MDFAGLVSPATFVDFAASVIRVAYGPGFARPVPVEDDAFTADRAETAVRYLLSA